MTMKITILRGIPGSGKSTYAKHNSAGATVVSADHFFEKSGTYQFNPAQLPEAHGECLRKFVEAVQAKAGHVVVDNTGTSIAEVAPYAALALAYGGELEIVTVLCDATVAAARNVHGVPPEAVAAMDRRLKEETTRLPPWWPHRTVEH